MINTEQAIRRIDMLLRDNYNGDCIIPLNDWKQIQSIIRELAESEYQRGKEHEHEKRRN